MECVFKVQCHVIFITKSNYIPQEEMLWGKGYTRYMKSCIQCLLGECYMGELKHFCHDQMGLSRNVCSTSLGLPHVVTLGRFSMFYSGNSCI